MNHRGPLRRAAGLALILWFLVACSTPQPMPMSFSTPATSTPNLKKIR